MKTEHTAGKWLIETNADHYPFIMGEDNNTIAMLFENDGSLLYGRTFEETQANAKLIAAATLLLEDEISDVVVIEDFIKRYKNGETKEVIYFLENLLVSKKYAIKKATE